MTTAAPHEPPPQSTGDGGETLSAEVVGGLDDVPAEQWNRLAGAANPFLRHEFLSALERHGCVGENEGWIPRHVLLRDGQRLVGAIPMYLKLHSYGEFVFDWSWADAYARAGLEYYPKLVVAIPFTPAAGPRLLMDADRGDPERLAGALVGAALEVARRTEVSSLHWLFTPESDTQMLERAGHMRRTGCQFHWRNPGYGAFQDYLDSLTSKKRKQIRKERREAAGAPLEIEMLHGRDVSDDQWAAYHALYSSTYDRKWGYPSLTLGFFREIGRTLPDSVVLALARRGSRYVAGAHFLCGKDTLYGRNWGCSEFHRSVHFEMCYYRAIEYCIDRGLERFEAGAQGEHKLSRGFLPVETRSAHWVRHPEFRAAIGDFLTRERRGTELYRDEMGTHSPFRRG